VKIDGRSTADIKQYATRGLTSKRRKSMKTTVAGGEKSVHTFQSPWTQVIKWDTPRNRLHKGVNVNI
jgi:hypothetical protein